VEVVVVAVLVGAVVVVGAAAAEVVVPVAVELVVFVVEATCAFPPQPATANVARLAITILFIDPS
jgi:hypothetical protein